MDPRSITLAALAASPDHALTRVQAQKLLFLIDRQLARRLNGPAFNFAPYHYGPYDKNVYGTLEVLAAERLVTADPVGPRQAFRLTPLGTRVAAGILGKLPGDVADHVQQLAAWVRSLSFPDLVSAIYRTYPEMRSKSIFQG